jgi:hypothetical protein
MIYELRGSPDEVGLLPWLAGEDAKFFGCRGAKRRIDKLGWERRQKGLVEQDEAGLALDCFG